MTELDHRLTNVEIALQNHEKWEEKNYESLKEYMDKQSALMAKIFDKLENRASELSACRTDCENHIDNKYVNKKDFELILLQRNEVTKTRTDETANSLRRSIEENTQEIRKFKTIIYTLVSVAMVIQFALINLPRIDSVLHPVSHTIQ